MSVQTLVLPHLPGTEDAATMETPLHRYIQLAVTSLAFYKGVILIDGPPGRGKTFSSVAAALSVHRPVYWLPLTGEVGLRAMYLRLMEEITGTVPTAKNAFTLGNEIKELLSSHPCWLFVDETQWADQRLLRVLRSIYDETSSVFGLVLLGQDLVKALERKEKGLLSRKSRLVEATELTPRQVIKYMRQYHPLFTRVDGPEMYELWLHAGGDFRMWAQLLEAAKALKVAEIDKLSKRSVDDIIELLGAKPIRKRAPAADRAFSEPDLVGESS